MNYSVGELRKNLEEKVFALGIDPRFRENPAYSTVIADMLGVISQMNLFEKEDSILVHDENGRISFTYNKSPKQKQTVIISKYGSDGVRCASFEKSIDDEGNHRTEAFESIAVIRDSGYMDLQTNHGFVDDYGCSKEKGECNSQSSGSRAVYSPEGIMESREDKYFPRTEKMLYIENSDGYPEEVAFREPRAGFDGKFYSEYFEKHTILRREKLDTAGIYSVDKKAGTVFSSVVPLSTEHSLRNMSLCSGYAFSFDNIYIPPLSQEKIDALIERENNPKVEAGLRKLAVGRDTYSYDSTTDSHFLREGFENSEKFSK